MFDRESRPTITESVVESADATVELADPTTDSAADPVKLGLWLRALRIDTSGQPPYQNKGDFY